MSDTYRRYRAIKMALMQCFGPLKGHQMRHLNTLVALIWIRFQSVLVKEEAADLTKGG